MTLDERDSREIVRGWEKCCPIDKWKIAFPNGPDPPPVQEQGWEFIDGKRQKVGYFLKLKDPRPFCYDIVQLHSDSFSRSRKLMDIEEEDDEEYDIVFSSHTIFPLTTPLLLKQFSSPQRKQ